jgi:hypothetical protein
MFGSNIGVIKKLEKVKFLVISGGENEVTDTLGF